MAHPSFSYYEPARSELEFGSWDELIHHLISFDCDDWIFRGQADYQWKLETRLERDLRAQGIDIDNSPYHAYDFELEAISIFQSKAEGRIPNAPARDDLFGWLALMQHYGAPTRLMDWSHSPLVALYFAYATANSAECRALWALNESYCAALYGNARFDEQRDFVIKLGQTPGSRRIEFSDALRRKQGHLLSEVMARREEWPLVVYPGVSDVRMAVQQGVFVCDGALKGRLREHPTVKLWPTPDASFTKDAEETASLRLVVHDEIRRTGPATLIRRIKLPSEWKSNVMRTLRSMNITADTLFPGLDGIGLATTLHVQSGRSVEYAKDVADLEKALRESSDQMKKAH